MDGSVNSETKDRSSLVWWGRRKREDERVGLGGDRNEFGDGREEKKKKMVVIGDRKKDRMGREKEMEWGLRSEGIFKKRLNWG